MADQQMLRLVGPQAARWPQPQPDMDTGSHATRRKGRRCADRLGHNEDPRLGPPQRDLLPEAGAHQGDDLEGRVGQGGRQLEVRHAQAVG